MFVEDYMSASPVTVREAAPLRDAVQLMRQHLYRQLPVLDEAGRLVGIVTDRDIRQTVGFGDPLRENLTVADVMTADPVTIPVSATLDEAVRLLTEHRFGALPVVNGKKLVGIITYLDALRALAHVFGLDQPGYRIEVALPEGFADVARAFQALKDCNGSLLAGVVSRTRRDGGEPALYLRVAPEQGKDVERRLRDATMVLLEPMRG
ncbi:MAG: CBS domain-containing protein [Planctomycetes bacterium]|nr:CBS domain-containing protein [Planctomycetota bacterium]